MKKKVVFISLPMNGISDDVIKANIEKAKEAYLAITKNDIHDVAFVNNMDASDLAHEKMDSERLRVWYLGNALQKLATCDEAFFCFGWRRSRGCQVEHDVCVRYGIPLVY